MHSSFSLENVLEKEKCCLICEKSFIAIEKVITLQEKGWDNFLKQAKSRCNIVIPADDSAYLLTRLYDKLLTIPRNEAIKYHENCRIILRTKQNIYFQRLGGINDNENAQNYNEDDDGSLKCHLLRRSTSNFLQCKETCFICNQIRVSDKNPYNQGGLARCSGNDTAEKLLERKNTFLANSDLPYHEAANRLRIILGGNCLYKLQ